MLLRLVINLFKFSWDTNQNKHIYLSKYSSTRQKRQPKVEGAETRTLNTADTVWKEEPFFFPPFLLLPGSPEDRHRLCRAALRTSPLAALEVLVFFFSYLFYCLCCYNCPYFSLLCPTPPTPTPLDNPYPLSMTTAPANMFFG